jgi:hypothetical protein
MMNLDQAQPASARVYVAANSLDLSTSRDKSRFGRFVEGDRALSAPDLRVRHGTHDLNLEAGMSRREKLLLAVVLALFAIAHVGGAFMLGGALATQGTPAALVHQGD